jgi:hypothetical protein
VFSRFFANTPQKLMFNYLRDACPDPVLWGEIHAYLVKGRRPKSITAQTALEVYLELREALSGLAAFRAAGELNYAALSSPCHDFACSYKVAAGMDSKSAMDWAQFLLAADYLLALAYEASLAPGVSRKEQAVRMEALFKKAQTEYLIPLSQEDVIPAVSVEEPIRPQAAPAAAAA